MFFPRLAKSYMIAPLPSVYQTKATRNRLLFLVSALNGWDLVHGPTFREGWEVPGFCVCIWAFGFLLLNPFGGPNAVCSTTVKTH